MTNYIVLLSNSNHKVAAMGTKLGQAFTSEAMAEKAAKEYSLEHPFVDTLVLPIEARQS